MKVGDVPLRKLTAEPAFSSDGVRSTPIPVEAKRGRNRDVIGRGANGGIRTCIRHGMRANGPIVGQAKTIRMLCVWGYARRGVAEID